MYVPMRTSPQIIQTCASPPLTASVKHVLPTRYGALTCLSMLLTCRDILWKLGNPELTTCCPLRIHKSPLALVQDMKESNKERNKQEDAPRSPAKLYALQRSLALPTSHWRHPTAKRRFSVLCETDTLRGLPCYGVPIQSSEQKTESRSSNL